MASWITSPTLHLDRPTDITDPALIAAGRDLLVGILREFPASTQGIADLVRARTAGRFMAEWKAAAALLDMSWRDIALANISYDLAYIALSCSTMAIATASGPVLARNLDWWPETELARASVGMWCDRDAWFSAGWPGFSGIVTGMSARGFAVALNAVSHPGRQLPTGYPLLLFLRRILEEAADFDDALDRLARTPLLSGGLLTLVGRKNHQRAVIERTPDRAAIRRPVGDAPLVTTNDFRKLLKPAASTGASIYETACNRFDAMTVLTGALSTSADIDDEALLEILTDDEILMGITVQHTIFRPADRYARVLTPRRLMPAD